MKAQTSRYNVLGVGVSALTLAQARDLVLSARGARQLGYVCVSPVHAISEAQSDPAYRRILNESFLTTPDGMPLVWLAPAGVERVYGPDLMLAVCDAGRAIGLPPECRNAGNANRARFGSPNLVFQT